MPCQNGNGPQSCCFSGKKFFHNLQTFEFMLWPGLKNGSHVQLCILTFFFLDILEFAVILLTWRNAVWFFPFVNLLKKPRSEAEGWSILRTGHIQDMQATVHKDVLILKLKSSCQPENPFYCTLCWGWVQLPLILGVRVILELLGFYSMTNLQWDC